MAYLMMLYLHGLVLLLIVLHCSANENSKEKRQINASLIDVNGHGLGISPGPEPDIYTEPESEAELRVIKPKRVNKFIRVADPTEGLGWPKYNISHQYHSHKKKPGCYCAASTCWRKYKLFYVASLLGNGLQLSIIIILLFWKKLLLVRNSVCSTFSSKRRASNTQNIKVFLKSYQTPGPKRYRFSEVKKITNSFRDKLGQGGWGSVFKGNLANGRAVAVKVLSKSKGNGEDFINEVTTIGTTNHVNIVTLLGFCFEGSKRALIYDFMPNGSLEKSIYANTKIGKMLNEEKLYQISLGVARGLEYLHRGCSRTILHLDIKPHNILLDQDLCPKISDFGLAKLLCATKESFSPTNGARGTIGYIAPELYCRNLGGVSHKSDVYSYGMMMLEMVGGRKNLEPEVQNTSQIYFPHWIYEHLKQQEDKRLVNVNHIHESDVATKMIMVGIWCIQTDPSLRPSMSKVVEMLEGHFDNLQFPPNPFPGTISSSS